MSNKQTQKVALEEEKVYIGKTDETKINSDSNNLTKYKDEVDDYYKKKKTKKTILIVILSLLLVVGSIVVLNVLNNNYMLNDGNGQVSGEYFNLSDNNTFILDGVTYTLPAKANDFIDNGWTIIFDKAEDEVDVIEEYGSVYVYFQKDGKEFEASLKSFDGKEVLVNEADVHEIYVDSSRTPDFKGPLNISIGDDTKTTIKTIENSGYAYEYDYYKTSYADSYSFHLTNDVDDDYYFSYYINCYDDKVDNISIYYNQYNYYN